MFVLNEFNATELSPAKFCSIHDYISCIKELLFWNSIDMGLSIVIFVSLKKYAEDENPIIATAIIMIGNIFPIKCFKNKDF